MTLRNMYSANESDPYMYETILGAPCKDRIHLQYGDNDTQGLHIWIKIQYAYYE